MTLYKLTSWLSLIFGAFAAASLLNPFFLFFSLLFSILGFVSATICIYQNAKYEYTKSWFTFGYVGLFLSSIPVLFLMYLIFVK